MPLGSSMKSCGLTILTRGASTRFGALLSASGARIVDIVAPRVGLSAIKATMPIDPANFATFFQPCAQPAFARQDQRLQNSAPEIHVQSLGTERDTQARDLERQRQAATSRSSASPTPLWSSLPWTLQAVAAKPIILQDACLTPFSQRENERQVHCFRPGTGRATRPA